MSTQRIPSAAIRRLSLYYRCLLESGGVEFISSQQLSQLTHFSAAQVRKDLTYFGQFGTQGKGYRIAELKQALLKILGIDREWKIALVGVGNLGTALLSYKGFARQGFKIIVAFDNDLRKIGKTIGRVVIKNINQLQDIIRRENIKVAILTVPVAAAEEAVGRLVKAGIRAILNFAPVRLHPPRSVEILNIDLSIELERLAYYVKAV